MSRVVAPALNAAEMLTQVRAAPLKLLAAWSMRLLAVVVVLLHVKHMSVSTALSVEINVLDVQGPEHVVTPDRHRRTQQGMPVVSSSGDTVCTWCR